MTQKPTKNAGTAPNKPGTYEIQTKSGKVVKKFRTKVVALKELKQLQWLLMEELTIVQVKEK